jgi:hypothetical protein
MSAFPILCALAASCQPWAAYRRSRMNAANVDYNEQDGDLLGVELLATLEGSIKGQLKIHPGGGTAPIGLFGSLTRTRMDLSGKSDRCGQDRTRGAVRNDTVAGVLRLEKGGKSRESAPEKDSKTALLEAPQIPQLQLVQCTGVIGTHQ